MWKLIIKSFNKNETKCGQRSINVIIDRKNNINRSEHE